MKKQIKKIGYIRTFDSTRGVGIVRDMDGNNYTLQFTSIKGWDKNNFQYPSKKDQSKNIQHLSCSFTTIEGSIVDKLVIQNNHANYQHFIWLCEWAEKNFEGDL